MNTGINEIDAMLWQREKEIEALFMHNNAVEVRQVNAVFERYPYRLDSFTRKWLEIRRILERISMQYGRKFEDVNYRRDGYNLLPPAWEVVA